MLVALIIVIVVSVLLVGGALVYAYVAGHVASDCRKELDQLNELVESQGDKLADAQKKVEELTSGYGRLVDINKELNDQNADKNRRVEELNTQVKATELAMKDLESRIDVLNAVADEKSKEIKRRGEELDKSSRTVEELRRQVSSETSMQEIGRRIEELTKHEADLRKSVEDWQKRIDEEKGVIKKLDGDKGSLEQVIKELKGEKELNDHAASQALDEKEKVLADLEKWRRTLEAVIRVEKEKEEGEKEGVMEAPEGGWDEWWRKMDELEKVMGEIGLDEKTVKSVHQAIWSSVWLPRVKEVGKKWKGVSGIYRLTSLDDENRCYVGQAIDIEDRWRQHVKKMTGVVESGDEKLYKERPDRLRWEVLEVGEGKEWLNDREKWWVDSLGCVEIGFNMKRGG